MKHTKGTSLSILCLPVHKMADCNRFLQCYSRHAYARLQEKLRGLEVYLVGITGKHERSTHGVALGAGDLAGRYREPPRRRR